MKTISISASRDYEVLVGRDLLKDIGLLVSQVKGPCRAAVITDTNVDPLYGGTVCNSLECAGFAVCKFVFDAGEINKNLLTYSEILSFLANNRLTRADMVVALGGGVVGDMAGFAAATYMRGIPFIQVPTTFLAAVDASVGGKTAVDLPVGKNLVGAFWPPARVICDCDTFRTLPEETFKDGVAESIKHGLIADANFFCRLAQGDVRNDIEAVVCRNVEIKQSFVSTDEFDRGRRNILNFGHTVGHAIEKCTGYAVTHGHAVSMGMAIVARGAERMGLCKTAISAGIIHALEKNGLPVWCDLSSDRLFEAAAGDKKRMGNTINLVYLEEIGAGNLAVMSMEELRQLIELGLQERVMDVTITGASLAGTVAAIPSKSHAHRALICAALSESPTKLQLHGTESKDIRSTIGCLKGLGADIRRVEDGVVVFPRRAPRRAWLDCGESGSTLRFLLPVAAALCESTEFIGSGRLPQRPLSPLVERMEEHGCVFSQKRLPLVVTRMASGGKFQMPGNITSQYTTGLLLAAPLLKEGVEVELTSPLESGGYVDITIEAMAQFGIEVQKTENKFVIAPGQEYRSPKELQVHGDWSNAAFWLVAGALSGDITCSGITCESAQGDRKILDILREMGAQLSFRENEVTVHPSRLNSVEIDAGPIPDLIPVVAVAAAVAKGVTHIRNAGRLRLKESDRLHTISAMLTALGGQVRELPDGMTITGVPRLRGGVVDSTNDHRIAMAAAIAACVCDGPVTIKGAEAVDKSYPDFWKDYESLGGVLRVI
jgi:3-phosphoshikimate 1-carboxyvinyltransferase